MSSSDGIDWDKDPTPSPDEFEEMQKADPNLWWRIGCGHHENLYDGAMDEIERLRAALRIASEALNDCVEMRTPEGIGMVRVDPRRYSDHTQGPHWRFPDDPT